MSSRADPGTRQAVLRGSVWQLASFVARFFGGFAAIVLLARATGPATLGLFQLAFALAALLGVAVGLGMPNLISREVARDAGTTRLWLESGTAYAGLAGIGLTCLTFVIAHVFGAGADISLLFALAVGAAALDAIARLYFAVFWGWERMHLESAATWLQEGTYVAGTVMVLNAGGGATAVMGAYLASRGIGVVAGWGFAHRHTGTGPWPRFHAGFVPGSLPLTIPFALDDVLSMAYIRIDSLLLGWLSGARAVGFYQAGTTLVLSLNVLARMINNALYPRMSRCWPHDPPRLDQLQAASTRVLAALGVPLMVGGIVLAEPLVTGVFGADFAPAVPVFQALALIIPARMIGHTMGTALTAADQQGLRTWAVGVAAVANVVLNLALIPRYSYLGAAWATVVTELGLLVAYAWLLRRRLDRPLHVARRALLLPSIACLPMVWAALQLTDRWFVIAVLGGGVVYLVTIVGLVTAYERRQPRDAMIAYVVGRS
ncbi:MAG: flippase [Actinomycetota bacterium]